MALGFEPSWWAITLSCVAVQEDYMSLTRKTLVFLQYVYQRYDADYIVKIDDDVYLRTDRLPPLINQWKLAGAGKAFPKLQGF